MNRPAVRRHLLCAVLLTLPLAACAAAAPGYIPPSSKNEKKGALALSKPFDSGKVAESGQYELTEAEKKLDCRKLTGSQQIAISRLQARKTSTAPSALATATQKATAPILKQSTVNADLGAEIAREHARFKAFNGLLVSKGCKPVEMPPDLAT
jgi:predicted small lipoprotein YifL